MALSLLYSSVTREAGGPEGEAMVKKLDESHKRSTTVGTTNKGNEKDVPFVGNIEGRRPVNVEDLGKIKKSLPAKGCCHRRKVEKM